MIKQREDVGLTLEDLDSTMSLYSGTQSGDAYSAWDSPPDTQDDTPTDTTTADPV